MSEVIVQKRDTAFGEAGVGKIGMWLFLIMDGLSFVTILIAAAYLRANGAPWPAPGQILNIALTAFNTLVLMVSSYTMMRAFCSIKEFDQITGVKYLWMTLGLGVIFLGIQVYEYCHLIVGGEKLAQHLAAAGFSGQVFRPTSSIYAACFYGATGFHGLHVLAGLIFMTYVLLAVIRGEFNGYNYVRVEALTLYWHFIDLMWMLIFTGIYLL